MRKTTKAAIIVAVAAASLGIAGVASAADGSHGVFFVHGTGDQSPVSSNHGFRATNDGAVGYWNSDTLNAFATNPADGSQYSYGVAGYGGGTYAAYDSNSWGVVGDQLYDYYYYGNNGAIYHIDVVTHSNGSNPVRYMQAHPTAVTPGGTTVSTILSHVERVIYIAGDNKGTPLADKVTTSGSLASMANAILDLFGGGYNNAAVRQQIQANMSTYNGNGTFATGTSPGGLSTYYVYGSGVYAAIWSGDAWCGGYAQTVGLKAAALYGWGTSSGTDGFIGTNSSTYVGLAGNSGDSRLNHNQSRRNCHGDAGTMQNLEHGAMSGTFTAIPADFTINPAAQACNATLSMWSNSNTVYWYGCSAAMRTDTNTDTDCYAAYGGDNGFIAPDNFSSTGYANGSYYVHDTTYVDKEGGGCSDSWLGDGTCDLCLVAKYGYDGASGGTANDDCVNMGSGSTTTCYDLAYDSTQTTTSKIRYLYLNAYHP